MRRHRVPAGNSTAYNPAERAIPTRNVTSPTPGSTRGTSPVNSSWLENSPTDTTIPTSSAISPAGLAYPRS